MDKQSANTGGLQDVLSNSLRSLADMSLNMMKPMMEGMMGDVNELSKSVYGQGGQAMKLPQIKLPQLQIPQIKIPQINMQDDCECCPPKQDCPPHCIASIKRCAMVGERIIVPFFVKNTCSHTKTYRIGVRELKDENGQLAPKQPVLNKHSVTLDPGRTERVLLMIDLANFNNGSEYSTDIVLREKEINQNICFSLMVGDDYNVVTATPLDEQKYKLKWQSWQSHYYCEPKRTAAGVHVLTNDSGDVKQ